MTDNTLGPWAVTMADIYAHSPCADGWAKLRKHTGLPATDNTTPVTLLTIPDSNGLDDALWCLRAQADPRSIAALDVAERYANGGATAVELAAARDAASDAARAAQEAKLRGIIA